MENFTRNQSFYTTSTTSVVWFSEEYNKSIPMACLYAVISFIAVFGNLLVITAVCRDHTLRSYTSNYFLANLAVADFFQGLIAIPLRILEVMAVGYNPHNCNCHSNIVWQQLKLGYPVLGNALVLTAIYTNYSLRNVGNALFGNLAVSDFLQGGIAIPCRIVVLLQPNSYFSMSMCRASIALSILFGGSSNLNILFISIERFIGVRWPFLYYSFVSAKDYIAAVYLLINILPSVIIASLRSIQKIHIQERSVRSSVRTCNQEDNGDIWETDGTAPQVRKNKATEAARQRKSAKTVSLIVGLFIVLIMPIVILDIVDMCGGLKVSPLVVRITVGMAYANHCVNVFVYAGCNGDYKRAFAKILSRIKAKFTGVRH
ncbi:hypothetical protein pdam_00000438 [Pocillopora damicornis]|uniref:G-protein coupled receptors family 1 profile domain-containing protein n=1 Tax=Pocillopora damicornis TaxID=46731 RepID=A0A3M6UJK6_POCDA|nr:hypothetical protein pdam_00000438 [Pocillopora damicornis]